MRFVIRLARRLGPTVLLRAGLLGIALGRLASAARTAPALAPPSSPVERQPSISVVIPARDEAARIGPLLAAVVGAPDVREVIVVDDRSTDGTGDIARRAGAAVVTGQPAPAGWAGKPWALQQGLVAARGTWVVTLDADARPDPSLPTAAVERAIIDRADLLTVAGRFDCPTGPSRALHAAMLTTLVYRFGPPGRAVSARRLLANGQCMVMPRQQFLDDGGLEPVAGLVVEDVALARQRAALGRRVGFVDGADLLTVRMYESAASTWSGWGRSLALPGVEPPARQALDVAVLASSLPLPLLRLVTGRADLVDLVALAARLGTLAGTRRAYQRVDAWYWASPLADLSAVAAVALGAVRRRQSWRGRTYRAGRAAQ